MANRAGKYKELRDKMSEQSRQRAEANTRAMLAAIEGSKEDSLSPEQEQGTVDSYHRFQWEEAIRKSQEGKTDIDSLLLSQYSSGSLGFTNLSPCSI